MPPVVTMARRAFVMSAIGAAGVTRSTGGSVSSVWNAGRSCGEEHVERSVRGGPLEDACVMHALAQKPSTAGEPISSRRPIRTAKRASRASVSVMPTAVGVVGTM